MMKQLVLSALLISSACAVEALSDGFTSPPQESHPRVWWHWMNAKVTQDGITKDLEAMQRVGIKGAQIFNMGAHREELNGAELILSPTWNAAVKHAAQECDRLGLKLGVSGGEGCSGSGGKWVPVKYSMQELVWSETQVDSGAQSVALEQPRTTLDHYVDISVLAFPRIASEQVPLSAHKPKITSDFQNVNWAAALDGDPATFAEIPQVPNGQAKAHLTLEFEKAIELRSLELDLFEEADRRQVKLMVSKDGNKWSNLGHVMHLRGHVPHGREIMINGFPRQEVRFVKLEFVATRQTVPAKLYNIRLQPYRVSGIHQKAARMRGGLQMSVPTNLPVPEGEVIARDQVLDLSEHLAADGTLNYEFPAGQWTVVRFGHTSKGNKSKPAAPQSAGLEVDKMCPIALEHHVKEGMLGKMAADLGDLTGSTYNCVNLDSWEAGCQTWTGRFPDFFTASHGYDSRKWLLAMTGRVVGSLDETERFLWDYRRTVADLIVDGYYSTLRRLLHEQGVMLEAEAPGTGMPIIADALKSLGVLDIVQGEFWLGGDPHPDQPGWTGGQDNTKEPACAAHVYGKEIVSCEAFTSFGHHDGWTQFPAQLKPYADRQFCKGMNEIVFHCSAHQPDDRAPGQTLGQFGLNFHRHLTWWEQGKAWIDYLARCQYMLRQGRFYADVLYFYGEDSPNSAYYYVPNALDPRQKMLPVLPLGYDYDVCDLTILNQITIENGEVVLPSGMRYKYLVLPENARYTPPALEKVLELVKAGATLIGPRPVRCPSLKGYPQADQKIKELAAQIWDGEHAGEVITGKGFEEILASDQMEPDFAYRSNHEDPYLTYIHRTLENGEMYFVSNQKDRAEETVLTFRTTGKLPEIWDPVTGERRAAAMYSQDAKTTSVALNLHPYESVFVLLQQDSSDHVAVTELLMDNKPVRSISTPLATSATTPQVSGHGKSHQLVAHTNGTYQLRYQNGTSPSIIINDLAEAKVLATDWVVSFEPDKGAPNSPVALQALGSLTDRAESGIKHYSGTASYKHAFTVAESDLAEGKELTLDLGEVCYLAEVIVNGENLGTLWQPPYRVKLSEAAKAGNNTLEVKVTNNWKNRLIGDAKLPVDQRTSHSEYPFYKGDEKLQRSGLIGPVRILSSQVVEIKH